MRITEYLIEKDPSLVIHNESEFSSDTKGFKSFNDAGLECETGEFLYALIRLLKPDFVLETGTHEGVGASYMGQALKDNGFGQLDTVEFLQPHHETSKKRMARLGLDNVVLHLGDVATFTPGKKYDLILLDTEPQTRFSELIKFMPNLNEGGFVFIHDLHRHMHQIPNEEHGFAWPYGKIPPEIEQWVKFGILRPFHFTTPRGLTGFYRPHEGDYKWQD